MKQVTLPNPSPEVTPETARTNKYYGVEHSPSQVRGFITSLDGKQFRHCWGYYFTDGNSDTTIGSHDTLEGIITQMLNRKGRVSYKVYQFDSFKELMEWVTDVL